MARLCSILLAAMVLCGCEGVLNGLIPKAPEEGNPSNPNEPFPGDPNNPDPYAPPPKLDDVTACTAAPTPGTAPLRRLSHEEYQNALIDLFADETLARNATKDFLPDTVSLGFRNAARFLDVRLLMAQEYFKAAEMVATDRVNKISTWLPCSQTGGEACAQQVISGTLQRIFRRPLSAQEQATYLALYTQGASGTAGTFATGVEWMLVTALQSPHFLYRAEVEGGLEARAVAPYELASRLSFLLWRSIPDDALLLAAQQGRLTSKADVEREARRMIDDPKAERVFEFFEQWLDIDEVNPLVRDTTVFPGLSASLSNSLRAEAKELVRQTVLQGEGGGSLETLLSAPFGYVNSALATHYGIPAPTQAGFQKVTWNSGKRGGLFMTTAALVSHDKQTRTSIVNRGLRLRTLVLCQNIPAPPNNVELTLGSIDENYTQADRLAQHRTDPNCAGCHMMMDPLGEPFENVDAVGRERSTDEGGRPVKTTGEIRGVNEALDGPVANGAELMQKLSTSNEVRECVVTQLFRFSHGRQEESADLCSRQRTFEAFKNAHWNVKELFVALAQSDDFLNKPAVTP